MDNSKSLRHGLIVNNELEKVDNERRVSIRVLGTLPMLAGTFVDRVTGVDGSLYGELDTISTTTPIVEDSSDPTTIGEVGVKNLLIDKDDENRFVFLGQATSTVSKLLVDIYYDNSFNDILVIPELSSLGTDDYVDFYSRSTVTLNAYSVGNGERTDKPLKDIVMPIVLNDLDGINEPKRFTETKTVLTSAFGLENNSMLSNFVLFDSDSKWRATSEKGVPIQLIALEENTILYDTVKAMNTYNVVQQFHDRLRIDGVGKHIISKIVFPLNF